MLGDFPSIIHMVSGEEVKTTSILGIGIEKHQRRKPRIPWEEDGRGRRGNSWDCLLPDKREHICNAKEGDGFDPEPVEMPGLNVVKSTDLPLMSRLQNCNPKNTSSSLL